MISFLSKILGLARPYRSRLILGVLTGIVAGLLDPLMIVTAVFVYGIIFQSNEAQINELLNDLPQFVPQFVRDWLAVLPNALTVDVKEHPGAVIALVALIPAVVFFRGLFSYLNIYLLQWVAIRTVTDLRLKLFGHIMKLSAGFFNRSNSGDLISRVTTDTNLLLGILSSAVSVIVKDPVTLISTFTILVWTDWKLTLISLVVFPLCIIPIWIFGRKVRRSAGNMRERSAELSRVMTESFTGNRVIKAYNLEGIVVERFRGVAQNLIGHYMRIIRALETPGPLMETFGAIGVALMILYLVVRPEGRPDDFLVFVGLIFTLYRPAKNLARLHNTLEQARAASARVFEILATKNTIVEPANPKPLKAAGAEIQFDDIGFNYDTEPVLQNIQLTVKPGQMVALVGQSGSGKTTLTNLLLRFYDPQSGAVRIGGIDIRDVSTLELRRQIAVVTQETVLFDDTIHRNIELGRSGATRDAVEAAAKHAHAHEFIMEKPQGYESIIGEKGVTLSGGQRQRLAIARAILKNAPILVLDEATSSLDTQSERAVQAALEELMQGRTTICIAHRLSTIQKADLIVVLEQGRIVETGRHNELLGRDSLYKKLYELQFRD